MTREVQTREDRARTQMLNLSDMKPMAELENMDAALTNVKARDDWELLKPREEAYAV